MVDVHGTSERWQEDAPLFAAWRAFVSSTSTPFTIPGHKRRAGLLDPDLGRLLDADVPLYGGADTVKLTSGVLAEAEARAAALWQADFCRFSTGGSTHANQVLCMAIGQPGDTVLVGRNAHRSVLGGLVLAGLRPVWLGVDIDATGTPLGLSPTTVQDALTAHPTAVAVLCTNPSYQGTLSDLTGVVAAAHDRGVAVVVDQAWGAHLGMAAGYPAHALQVGADAMITSAHKMLPAFSQAAVVLARTERLDAARVHRAFEATHTTSPSAAILASIDAARAFLAATAGRGALTRIAELVDEARGQLVSAGLDVPCPADFPAGRFDPAKLVVRFGAAGRDGLAAEAALLARGVPVEMADRDTVVAQIGLTDDATTVQRLVDGILSTTGGPAGAPRRAVVPSAGAPPQHLTPREAFFARYEVVPRSEAVGRISAELVAPYPPGIPLLVPGEEVTVRTLAALEASLRAGNRIAYAADPLLGTVHVVADYAADSVDSGGSGPQPTERT